jgi:hypothetical protein
MSGRRAWLLNRPCLFGGGIVGNVDNENVDNENVDNENVDNENVENENVQN